MDNVKPIGVQAYTPKFVLEQIAKHEELEQIFVVGYRKGDRMPMFWLAGDLDGLKTAVFDLNRAADQKVEELLGKIQWGQT